MNRLATDTSQYNINGRRIHAKSEKKLANESFSPSNLNDSNETNALSNSNRTKINGQPNYLDSDLHFFNKSKSSKIINPLLFNNINRSSENEFENAWEIEKTNKSLSTTNNKNSSLHVKLSKRDDIHETGKSVLVIH